MLTRRPLRLPGYDYSQAGAYFLTICVTERKSLLGKVADGKMNLNVCGEIVAACWKDLSLQYPALKLDAFVVMPNHVHGIIEIVGAGSPRPPLRLAATDPLMAGGETPPLREKPTLGQVVRHFKYQTTRRINALLKKPGTHVWQRSFYEHVVRDDESLNRIREYIASNPLRWDLDRENPQARGEDEFDLWLAKYKNRPPGQSRRDAPACAPQPNRRQLGQAGEDLAVAALKKAGYKILARNYLTPLGEIDLVARHRGALVFVEVKTRRGARFGAPQEAVSGRKQARLQRLADYYLKQQRLGPTPTRFDVVAISMAPEGPRVEIIPQAFGN